MLKYSLGIDISAKDFSCCMSSIDTQQVVKILATTKFSNTPKGFQELDKWILKHWTLKHVPLVVTMEATGVYYERCALYLSQAGYHVSVVLPNKAKKYLQAIGLKTKNDTIDAKGLARMAAEQSLAVWQPMSVFFFTLRAYTRQLQSLQEMKTSVSNQLHAAQLSMYPVKVLLKQLKEMVRKIEQQIEAMEEAIEKHIVSDNTIALKVEKLCSIKGVGLTTVAVVLAETNGFALIENVRQLASYAGYDVVENQSGTRTGRTRISKKGNSRIRRILYMPALNMVRYKVVPFVTLFNRTLEKHHIKMKSYVAIQKKLLITLYTLWKKDEAFNEKLFAAVEAVTVSRSGFEEAQNKSSFEQVEATEGRHSHLVAAFAASR